MKNALFMFLLAASTACHAQATARFPKDVVTFMERRDACDYFRGEVANVDDRKRLEDIIRKANSLCRGTDKQLAKLRKKYAENAAVTGGLKQYDDAINAPARN
ncbi:hypothetical protein [Massilia genomosp. 1]|uniref:Uncharacterized protein n=1 Tax=Massilia genomosp. 1 TaxID=2609280 RepID=A0ABX0MHF5_9BURK|nr:hypothetical protein [Massilia genomosp. 1]NHZ62205.1 hypothetical protein [Massilia genomosp. 1]